MATDIVNVNAEKPISIKNTGEPGELVCRKPFPSQPVKSWGVDGMKRYQSSYFERFGDDCWNQGDFVQMTTDPKGFLMLGRS
jgi:acetoacetyl-CoA synthetase